MPRADHRCGGRRVIDRWSKFRATDRPRPRPVPTAVHPCPPVAERDRDSPSKSRATGVGGSAAITRLGRAAVPCGDGWPVPPTVYTVVRSSLTALPRELLRRRVPAG